MGFCFLVCLIFLASVEVTCYEGRVVGRKDPFVISSMLLLVSLTFSMSPLYMLTSLQSLVQLSRLNPRSTRILYRLCIVGTVIAQEGHTLRLHTGFGRDNLRAG